MDYLDITPVIVSVLTLVLLTVVGVWIRKQFAKLWDTIEADPESWALEYFVEALCDAAETFFDGPGRGKEKLAWVLNLVEKECNRIGVTFNAAEVQVIIENFVDVVINAGNGEDPAPV